MFVGHLQSVSADHARKDVLLAIPPIQVLLNFIVVDILRRQILQEHRGIRSVLPGVVIIDVEAGQLANETFIDLPILVGQ